MVAQSFKFYNSPDQQEDCEDRRQSHADKDGQRSPHCLNDTVDGAACDDQSLNYFQKVLQNGGVFEMLEAKGCRDGHTVSIYDFEFDYVK